jgi:hypothetical protein
VLWPNKGQDEEGELCNVGVATVDLFSTVIILVHTSKG